MDRDKLIDVAGEAIVAALSGVFAASRLERHGDALRQR